MELSIFDFFEQRRFSELQVINPNNDIYTKYYSIQSKLDVSLNEKEILFIPKGWYYFEICKSYGMSELNITHKSIFTNELFSDRIIKNKENLFGMITEAESTKFMEECLILPAGQKTAAFLLVNILIRDIFFTQAEQQIKRMEDMLWYGQLNHSHTGKSGGDGSTEMEFQLVQASR